MEILSVSFAIFLIKLTIVVLPILLALKLVLFTPNKDSLRKELSSKLLGDPSLIKSLFFNICIYLIAAGALIIGFLLGIVLLR